MEVVVIILFGAAITLTAVAFLSYYSESRLE